MTTNSKSLYGEKNREIALVLLLSFRILTSTDDKDDNDITEPERDDDRLFDKNSKFHVGKKGKRHS